MTKYLALAALAVSAIAGAATAGDVDARAVAPYLDEQTFAVLHVDLSAVDVNGLIDKAAALAGTTPDALPVTRKEAAAAVKALNDVGAHDLYVVFSLADAPERPPFLVVPLEKGAVAKEIQAELEDIHPLAIGYVEKVGDALIRGDEATIKRLRDLKPVARPELAKAFAAADGSLAQLVILPPKDAAKIIEEIMPTLPAEVGGGSSKVLTRGFRWAAVGLDAPKLKLNLTVQASDADAAKALLDLLDKTYAAVGKDKQVREALPDYDKLTRLLTPKVSGDRLTLTLDERELTPIIRPLFAKAHEAAWRLESSNHLKQLGLATYKYFDAHGTFPGNTGVDKKGNALLSWRVQLLPYLGEDKLYKEFHLDEPWDSDHNKKLIARMPAVFRSPTTPKLAVVGRTTYLAPVGDATMFPDGRGVRISEVTDGTSNTILFVDADDEHAVIWTKPDDLTYDPKTPEKGLGFRYSGCALAAFADGSVHLLAKGIDKATLRALFTRNGGEVVNVP